CFSASQRAGVLLKHHAIVLIGILQHGLIVLIGDGLDQRCPCVGERPRIAVHVGHSCQIAPRNLVPYLASGIIGGGLQVAVPCVCELDVPSGLIVGNTLQLPC